MLTTLALINTLFASSEWQLYTAAFPADADGVIMALAEDGPGLSECVDAAINLCQPGHVCHLCFVANTDGTTVCSFVCGEPGGIGGCPPPPPCPRPKTDVSTESPAPVDPED